LARLLLILANYGKEIAGSDRAEDQSGNSRRDDRHQPDHVTIFMTKFRQLGFIEYNGDIKVHRSLLTCCCTKSRTLRRKSDRILNRR